MTTLTSEWIEETYPGLVSSLVHWNRDGITTRDGLERYLLICAYSDGYKAVNGFRPRGVDYDSLTIEVLRAKVDDLLAEFAEQDWEIDPIFYEDRAYSERDLADIERFDEENTPDKYEEYEML